MLPTLALIKNGKVEDYIVGLEPLGGKDDFDTEVLAERLGKSEIIDHDFARLQPNAPAQKKAIRKGGYQKTETDEDSDFD